MRLLVFLFFCITLFTIPSHANSATRLRDTITSHHHGHGKHHQQTHEKHHIQHGHQDQGHQHQHHQQKHHGHVANKHHNKHHVDIEHHDKHENKHHHKHENKHHIDNKHHNKHHMEHTTDHHIKQKHHHQHQTDADADTETEHQHKHHVAIKHGHHIKHAMQNKHKHPKKCKNSVPMPKIQDNKKYNILIEGTARTKEELHAVGKLIHKWVKMMASDVEYKLKHDQILMMTPNGPIEGKLARRYVSTLMNEYCLRVSATEG